MSRALASTKNMFNLCIKFMLKSEELNTYQSAVKNLPKLLFLKGKSFKNELNDMPVRYQNSFTIHQSITSEEGKILVFERN